MWLDSKAVNCPQKWGNFNVDWEESIWCLLIHRRPAKDPLWQDHASPPEDTTTLADPASYSN